MYSEGRLILCKCGCGGKLRERDKHYRTREYISGHNGRKYKDPKQYKREWKRRNGEKVNEIRKRFGRRKKVRLIALKKGKCKKCGLLYNGKNASVFDFHHRDPGAKDHLLGLAAMDRYSWKQVLKESKKCDLVCSNCHRMIHSGEY
jgi:predicted HNH restriction endonuclease